MPPDEPVEKFRIEYVPAAGGNTEVVSIKNTCIVFKWTNACMVDTSQTLNFWKLLHFLLLA